jgi:hypothetical protein
MLFKWSQTREVGVVLLSPRKWVPVVTNSTLPQIPLKLFTVNFPE